MAMLNPPIALGTVSDVYRTHLLKLGGEKMPATYRDWVKANPNMTIEAIDETDPNLTA